MDKEIQIIYPSIGHRIEISILDKSGYNVTKKYEYYYGLNKIFEKIEKSTLTKDSSLMTEEEWEMLINGDRSLEENIWYKQGLETENTIYVRENSPAYEKYVTKENQKNRVYIDERKIPSKNEVKNVQTRIIGTEGEWNIQEVTFEYFSYDFFNSKSTDNNENIEYFETGFGGGNFRKQAYSDADLEGDKLLEDCGQNELKPNSSKTDTKRRSRYAIVAQKKNLLGQVKEENFAGYKIVLTRTGLVKPKNTNKSPEVANSTYPITITDDYYAPEDPPTVTKTPDEVNEETQKETDKKEEQQQTTDVTQTEPEVTKENTPTELTPKGPSKLAIFLNGKRSEIKRNIIPLLIPLATQLGIKAIGTLQSKLPDFCLPEYELNRIINTRNQIVNKLNAIVKIIDTFSKILTGFNLVISITSTLLKTINTSRQSLSALAKTVPNPVIPTLPGAVVTGLDDLKEASDKVNKKLDKFNGAIAAASVSLAVLNATLLTVISMINSIDICITKCKPDASLLPLSSTLLELEKMNKQIDMGETQQSYKGFSLEIVEEPYSPTVNRRRAVAKNQNGIIELQTPLTFSTDTQTLINEIKLVIDSNNLKAN